MRFLIAVLVAHLLVGLSFIVAFKFYFNYSLFVIFLHALLLLTGLALLLLPCFYWPQGNQRNALRAYLLIALPLFDFVLLLIYICSVLSNVIWSGNITLQLAASYIVDFGVMRETLPVLNFFLFALPLMYFGLLSLYRLLLKRYFTAEPISGGYRLKLTTYSALAVVVITLLFEISFDKEDPGIWNGEPLSNLFLDYIPMFEFDQSVDDLRVLASEISDTPRSGPIGQPPNVIIIMVDALRADHLQAYGYHRETSPFLSSLIDQGNLVSVDMMRSTCSESTCGILSVLTGKEFADIRSNSTHIGNILSANGYTSSFVVTGNHAWGGLRTMYDADFFSDGETRENFSVNDDAGIIDTLQNLELGSNDANFLYFHLYSAHELGLRHRQFNKFLPQQSSFNSIRSLFADDEERHQWKINNYDNGILQADFFISQIFAQLERQGILQNSLVYITSDHGQGFGEHGHYGHTRFLYEEHIRIPLYIYDSQDRDYQNTQYATHIDIAPTILESLGITNETKMQGLSLLRPSPEFRITRHQSTTADGWKLDLIKRGEQTYKHLWEGPSYAERHEELLYEVTGDPEEQINMIETTQGQQIINLAVEGLLK